MIERPTISPAPPWAFPQPQQSGLDSGLEIWAYDLPGQFILSCNLVLEIPLNAEPGDRDGVATITARCLDEGTTTHPGPQLAQAFEDIGAQFSALVGLSTNQALLDLPNDSLAIGLDLFAETIRTPQFAPADVRRIIANRLAEIEQQESRGSFLASTILRQSVFATGLRIARPAGGSLASVGLIDPGAVTAFHDRCYRPGEAKLIIVGDLSGLDVFGLASQAFADWTPPPAKLVPEPVRAGEPRRLVVHRDHSVQADIRLGWPGIDRHDERWADLQVALTIMGGSFGSRLNTCLREERGYTYGVSMNAHPFRSGGQIDIATATQTANTAALIDETLAILATAEAFTPDEVADAIGYLSLSAPLTLDTAEAVAAQAATLAAARLDLDYVNTSLAALARVSPDSALAAYRSLIDPDQASIVVVADTADLPELGYDTTE